MSMTNEMISELVNAKNMLEVARTSGLGVNAAKERMKNILFNYCDDLVADAKECASLREEVEALEAALEESDEENKKLRSEIQSKPHQKPPAKKE